MEFCVRPPTNQGGTNPISGPNDQKNGWKGVCVHQEANVEAINYPIWALDHQVTHLRETGAEGKTFLLSFFYNGLRFNVCGKVISKGLKMADTLLQYPATQGIPIKHIDAHSLRSRGAHALALSGYSDTQIQKMGRWKGATFKEYIREELACYLAGMSMNMKQTFKFVNVSGNAWHNFTTACIEDDCNVNCAVAA